MTEAQAVRRTWLDKVQAEEDAQPPWGGRTTLDCRSEGLNVDSPPGVHVCELLVLSWWLSCLGGWGTLVS